MKNIVDEISIFDVASKFGVRLEGKAKLYHSPFRKDEHPSFSIYGGGRFFKDLATGDKGNVITFLARLKNISTKEAYKILVSEFDNGSLKGFERARNSYAYLEVQNSPQGQNTTPKETINAPEKFLWVDELAETISKHYSLSVEALKYAFDVGCFGFGHARQTGNVWFVGDNRRLAFQIRRMDGGMWKFAKGESKAWTLKHSDCSYPIGLENAKNKEMLFLCEGSTDFLACFHFAHKAKLLEKIAPLAMLGAKQRIGLDYLREFQNKDVVLIPDNDIAGELASSTWGHQLARFAKSIRVLHIPKFKMASGAFTKDLCDLLKVEDALINCTGYANPFSEFTKGAI